MDPTNWDDAKVFLALARQGTLTAAAQVLGSGIATVSRRVERLEAAVGVPLFLRHQSGYRLSDQGQAMLPRFEAAEAAMLSVARAAGHQGEISGHVRVASIESLVAPVIVPALAPLLAQHSGLNVDVQFQTATVNLHQRDSDIAVRMTRPDQGHLVARRVGGMGFGLYGPPDGARPERQVTWADHDTVAAVLRWSRDFGSDNGPRFAANTLAAQIAAVSAGVGVGVLPHFLARAAGLCLHEVMLPDGGRMVRDLYVVTHADLSGSARVRVVLECIAEALTARRADLLDP